MRGRIMAYWKQRERENKYFPTVKAVQQQKDDEARNKREIFEFFRVQEDHSIPNDFKKDWPLIVEPREVQLRALAKGYGKPGFAYFMRQRLGKTWTAFAEFTLLRQDNLVDWMVVICPNSIKDQWKDAIEEVNPAIPICVYNSQRKGDTDYWFANNNRGGVLIINYESVKAFMANEMYKKFPTLRTYIVADESTKIKDPAGKTCKACLTFAGLCAYKRVLTGKPRANSNADLWSQLSFIDATTRTFTQHKYTFSVYGGYQGKTVLKDVNMPLLKKEIEPYCYIAEDKDIKDFHKVYEPMRLIKLTGNQEKAYKDMEEALLVELGSNIKITAPIALVKYLRLQQISSGIAGDIDGEQHNIVEPENNPKIKEVINILENEIDNKVIIVCRFRLSIDNLYQVLTKEGYKCAKFVGGMSSETIQQVKKDFNEGDVDVLIAQIQVLSYGHTLCATDEKPCDSVIFYENNFSLIDRSQCESRPEKAERKKPISYYDMYASKMDKYMLQSLIRKEDGAMALMNYARTHGIFGEVKLE